MQFNDDGHLRIMVLSDFQDRDFPNAQSVEFLETALDTIQPDLVVMCGDQLSDSFPLATTISVRKAIENVVKPMNDRQIPFLFAFGNHDHDRGSAVSMNKQADMYRAYEYCLVGGDGCDAGTYNRVVCGSDGVTPVFNIYMMDTNNTTSAGPYDCVHAEQVQWYREKSAELKALNGGEPLPSFVFQHIPVKEIYGLLDEVTMFTDGAVSYAYPQYRNAYYVLDESKILEGTYYSGLNESPCSEAYFDVSGQYEAWLECGDITLGAYFGHDHVNDFVGVNDNGIRMGYVGGFGFATYGPDDNRCVKVIDIDENDVESYTVKTVRYCDLQKREGCLFFSRILDMLASMLESIKMAFSRITGLLQNAIRF